MLWRQYRRHPKPSNSMKKVIVVTGTPGTGKTTLSQKLAGLLGSCELIKANDIVREKKLFTSYDRYGSMIVNMKKLSAEVNRRVAKSKADFVIVEGHLLCDIKVRGAVAIVIREHLDTLLGRLKERKYARQKIEDNIVSEGTDYCGVRASGLYSQVYEVAGGRGALQKMLKIAKGGRVAAKDIDLLEELNGVLKKL